MEYILSKKYDTPELQALIMGPNPVKLEEELLRGSHIPAGAVVCDLGSGTGLTSVFMAKEYGFTVYAADHPGRRHQGPLAGAGPPHHHYRWGVARPQL